MILLSLLPQSYDHIFTTMLYGKETLILEEDTSTILSNEIRKRLNQEEHEGLGLMLTGRKERGEERKVRAHQRHVTFITAKIIGIMTASIRNSG